MDRRNPFEEVEELLESMRSEVGGALPDAGSVPVDLLERDDAFEVRFDLPGYDREDLTVTVEDGRLQVTASRETEATEEGERYVRRERSRGTVRRGVQLPGPVTETEASASFDDGVLTVTLPREGADDEGHRIEVN